MKRYEIMLELFMECLILIGQIFLCIYIIPKTLGFLWPFVTGWIIALITWPITRYLHKRFNINKRFISVIILVLLIVGIGGILFALIAALGREALHFMTDMPDIFNRFLKITEHIPDIFKSLHLVPDVVSVNMDQVLEYLKNGLLAIVSQIGSAGVDHAGAIASNVTNFLIGIIVSILSAYFFIAYKETMNHGYFRFFPKDLRARIEEIWFHIKNAIGGYVAAQFKLMAIIFVILSIGLFIAGNPYALFVAFLIAIVDIIPFLGTGFVLIPWACIDFIAGNYSLMVLRLILYIICLLGRQLLQPKIIGDSVGLHPFVTLVLIYVGFKVDGIRGFLLAMIIGIILLNFYKLGLFDKKLERFKHLFKLLNQANDAL